MASRPLICTPTSVTMNFARPILVAFSLALFAQSTLSLPINAAPPRLEPPRNLPATLFAGGFAFPIHQSADFLAGPTAKSGDIIAKHCGKCTCGCSWAKPSTCHPPGDGSCCWNCCCSKPHPPPPPPTPTPTTPSPTTPSPTTPSPTTPSPTTPAPSPFTFPPAEGRYDSGYLIYPKTCAVCYAWNNLGIEGENGGVVHLGERHSWKECEDACSEFTRHNGTRTCKAWTWMDGESGLHANQCYGRYNPGKYAVYGKLLPAAVPAQYGGWTSGIRIEDQEQIFNGYSIIHCDIHHKQYHCPISAMPGVKYLGKVNSEQLCADACKRDTRCTGWTWHSQHGGTWVHLCYGRVDGKWGWEAFNLGMISGRSADHLPPGQNETKLPVQVYGYWKWYGPLSPGVKTTLHFSKGVKDETGSVASSSTSSMLREQTSISLTVGESPPSETGGASWSLSTSFSMSHEETQTESKSWSTTRDVSTTSSCDIEVGGPGYYGSLWLWVHAYSTGLPGQRGIGYPPDCNTAYLLTNSTCGPGHTECRPLFTPEGCNFDADKNCQVGKKGYVNLKTGKYAV